MAERCKRTLTLGDVTYQCTRPEGHKAKAYDTSYHVYETMDGKTIMPEHVGRRGTVKKRERSKAAKAIYPDGPPAPKVVEPEPLFPDCVAPSTCLRIGECRGKTPCKGASPPSSGPIVTDNNLPMTAPPHILAGDFVTLDHKGHVRKAKPGDTIYGTAVHNQGGGGLISVKVSSMAHVPAGYPVFDVGGRYYQVAHTVSAEHWGQPTSKKS